MLLSCQPTAVISGRALLAHIPAAKVRSVDMSAQAHCAIIQRRLPSLTLPHLQRPPLGTCPPHDMPGSCGRWM